METMTTGTTIDVKGAVEGIKSDLVALIQSVALDVADTIQGPLQNIARLVLQAQQRNDQELVAELALQVQMLVLQHNMALRFKAHQITSKILSVGVSLLVQGISIGANKIG